jgi:hypothetical protein
MAGLVPAIHDLSRGNKNVEARAFASTKRLGRAGGTSPGMTSFNRPQLSER